MARPKNSKVRHGMASCARYGCRLEICLNAEKKARRNRDPNGSRVSSEEAVSHVGKLIKANMPPAEISRLSGVSQSLVNRIVRGESKRMLRVNLEAILGVSPPGEEYVSQREGLVNSIGSTRRLRALAVQGFSLTYLSQKSGLAPQTLRLIRSQGRNQVWTSRMQLFSKLHDELWDVDPVEAGMSANAAARAKGNAKKRKWWPTEAWSDIDDPACKPSLKTPRSVVLVEDFKELIQVRGVTREDAAKRLGVRVNTVEKAIERYAKIAS